MHPHWQLSSFIIQHTVDYPKICVYVPSGISSFLVRQIDFLPGRNPVNIVELHDRFGCAKNVLL